MATTHAPEPADTPADRPGAPWWRLLLVALGVLILLGGGAVLLIVRAGHDPGVPAKPGATRVVGEHSPPYPGIPSGRTATPGWRLESSAGLEIEVPDGWAVNDFGCAATDAPSVVRGPGGGDLCYRPEAPTKQVAEFQPLQTPTRDGIPAGFTDRPVTVDGVAAVRSAGRLEDGRAETFLTVASRQVRLAVRGTDPAVLDHILASVRVVEVDHLGCATTHRPAELRPPAPAGLATLVPAAVAEVDVCYYGEPTTTFSGPLHYDGELQSSAVLAGADAQRLATGLNAGTPGHNPDSGSCLAGVSPVQPDAVLLFRAADGRAVPVYLTSSNCWSRGFDNGSQVVQVTWSLLNLAYAPLHTGFGVTGDIPGLPDSGPSKPERS